MIAEDVDDEAGGRSRLIWNRHTQSSCRSRRVSQPCGLTWGLRHTGLCVSEDPALRPYFCQFARTGLELSTGCAGNGRAISMKQFGDGVSDFAKPLGRCRVRRETSVPRFRGRRDQSGGLDPGQGLLQAACPRRLRDVAPRGISRVERWKKNAQTRTKRYENHAAILLRP